MYKVPPLLNRFRLPSSHEKSKPAQGCHGAGLCHGSPKPIPPAKTFADRGPAGTSCPWLFSPRLLGDGKGVQYARSQSSLVSGDSTVPAEPGPPLCQRAPHGTCAERAVQGWRPSRRGHHPQGHRQAEAVALVAFALQALGSEDTGCPRAASAPAGWVTSPVGAGTCWPRESMPLLALCLLATRTQGSRALPRAAPQPQHGKSLSLAGSARWQHSKRPATNQPLHPQPQLQPRARHCKTHSSKPRRGLGQEEHPRGIVRWTTDNTEMPEQVEFLSTNRLLTLERLMWERDLSPSQSSLCRRH